MNSLIQCGHLYSQQNAPTAYLYQECTESPIKKIKLEAIAYKMDKIIKRQHINDLVTMNKLATKKVNVLAAEKDDGKLIVAGCFNKFGRYFVLC